MATVSLSDLEQYGIDMSTVLQAIGPKKVVNRRDGTIEVENHNLKDIIEAVKYFRQLQNGTSRTSIIKQLGFAQVRPSNSNGTHRSC